MASKIEVNLDTSKELYEVFKCKQNDDLTLIANIYENGAAKDLTNCSIVVQAKKSDNTYVIQNADITKSNNTFTTELVRDFTRAPGETKIEVVLVESGKQNTTFSFCLEVIGSVIRGAEESKDLITSLEVMQDAVVEMGKISDETKELINNSGAASKEDFNKVNTQLAEKAQKEDVRLKYVKITQSDVSEELLQQIAGNTPINSIPADGSVTLSKTTFQPVSNGVLGKNLFDKTRCKIDKGLSNNTGLEIIAQGYFASDFIPVIEGQKYTISKMNQGAFYDKNKAYVSDNTMNYFPAIKKTITVPTGVSFFRFSNMINIIDNIQMELGILTTDYEPYGYVLRDKSVGSNQIKDKAIKTANIDDYTIQLPHIGFPIVPFHKSKNLFNKDDITTDMFVSYINGNLSSNTSYVASNYIKIEANTNYTINYFDQMAWYDENKVYISGVDGYQLGVKTITSPSNAVYMRLSIRKTALDSYQLEEGTTSTTFEDFGVSITERMLHKNLLNKLDFQRINNVMNKLILSDTTINIKLLGDSITHGQGGTGFAQTGDLIYDAGWASWRVNLNGHCWANSLKECFEDKFNCLVKNYGMTGANSETIKVAIQNNKLVEDTDDIIILCVGTNDRNIGNASGDKLRLYNNISTIVDLIKSKGKKVILMSNIPSSIENETDNKAFHMEDVDHIIMKIASEKAMEYISIYKLFIEYCKSKNITIDSLLKDGLHPNDDGYDVMFYLICTALGFGVKRDGATW